MGAVGLASASAGATTKAISLELHGGRTGPSGRSCGVSPRWTYYKVGGTVRFSGRVTSPTAGSIVTINVRRCFAPRFTVVKTQSARTRVGGVFSGSVIVHVRSDCYVQAASAGRASRRAYFRVR